MAQSTKWQCLCCPMKLLALIPSACCNAFSRMRCGCTVCAAPCSWEESQVRRLEEILHGSEFVRELQSAIPRAKSVRLEAAPMSTWGCTSLHWLLHGVVGREQAVKGDPQPRNAAAAATLLGAPLLTHEEELPPAESPLMRILRSNFRAVYKALDAQQRAAFGKEGAPQLSQGSNVRLAPRVS